MTATAGAQEYRIESSTIDAGGGASEGGRFRVEGTIGQPETGTATGGRYTFEGGFWGGGVQAVQVAGLPQLRIMKQGKDTVVLTWDDPEGRFALQESGNLAAAAWSAAGRTIQADGATRRVTVTGAAGRLFFRLSRK